MRLSLGELSANLLQVVKRTNTLLMPQHVVYTLMLSLRVVVSGIA